MCKGWCFTKRFEQGFIPLQKISGNCAYSLVGSGTCLYTWILLVTSGWPVASQCKKTMFLFHIPTMSSLGRDMIAVFGCSPSMAGQTRKRPAPLSPCTLSKGKGTSSNHTCHPIAVAYSFQCTFAVYPLSNPRQPYPDPFSVQECSSRSHHIKSLHTPKIMAAVPVQTPINHCSVLNLTASNLSLNAALSCSILVSTSRIFKS